MQARQAGKLRISGQGGWILVLAALI